MISKKILIAGLVASIAMAMLEMIYEGILGVGFWSTPVFIAATILRDLQTVATPALFAFFPVMLGIVGHMMNSVVLGIVFVLAFNRFLNSPTKGAITGMVYGLIIFTVMWLMVLPLIDPVMLKLNPTVFALSHVLWGAVLGLMVGKKSNYQKQN